MILIFYVGSSALKTMLFRKREIFTSYCYFCFCFCLGLLTHLWHPMAIHRKTGFKNEGFWSKDNLANINTICTDSLIYLAKIILCVKSIPLTQYKYSTSNYKFELIPTWEISTQYFPSFGPCFMWESWPCHFSKIFNFDRSRSNKGFNFCLFTLMIVLLLGWTWWLEIDNSMSCLQLITFLSNLTYSFHNLYS